MRNATVKRKTTETDTELTLSLEGGAVSADTGCGFLDHMLTLFGFHGGFGLTVKCRGDVKTDYHHTVEDTGIALGQAFAAALGDKRGIERYGFMILPMDEALILTSADISGRAYLGYDVVFLTEKTGDFDTELVKEFWYGFVRSAGITLHIKKLDGENSHHIAEAVFKSAAKALRAAVSERPCGAEKIPSTKGAL